MVINRVTGLVLPASTKFLVDDVIGKHRTALLLPLVGVVLVSTMLQGITSFALTQTLSKAAQRLIAELRSQVQEHVGRLPLAYFDSTKAGALVSRIMTDVEGVRNLIGTGLIDFAGGLLTAAIAFVVLLRISPVMTAIAFGFLLVFGVLLRKAFQTIRPIFRERGKINAEVIGRLTESLGGIRVVKGYHAEAREHRVFASGIERLLQNVFRTLTASSLMALSSAMLMGVVGAIVMLIGSRQILAGNADPRRLSHLHHVSRIPGRAAVPGGRHRHPAYRGIGWTGAHPRGAQRKSRRRGPAAHPQPRQDRRRSRVPQTSPSAIARRSQCCTRSASWRRPAR